AAAACACMLALAAGPAPAAPLPVPAVTPPVTLDGPSAAIASVAGVALARDGSGAVLYTKLVDGVAHLFAALETRGSWGTPVAVDAPNATASGSAAVAA